MNEKRGMYASHSSFRSPKMHISSHLHCYGPSNSSKDCFKHLGTRSCFSDTHGTHFSFRISFLVYSMLLTNGVSQSMRNKVYMLPLPHLGVQKCIFLLIFILMALVTH